MSQPWSTTEGGHLRRTPHGIKMLKAELNQLLSQTPVYKTVIGPDGDKYIEPDFMLQEAIDNKIEALRSGDDLNKGGVKFDAGKARYDLLPPEGSRAVATILEFGARKYAARNWEQGMDWSRPFSAMQRHLWAWWEGEKTDPDSGYSHLWHAACNLFFLIAYETRGKGKDDRPLPPTS